jgi:hypothetical protein
LQHRLIVAQPAANVNGSHVFLEQRGQQNEQAAERF